MNQATKETRLIGLTMSQIVYASLVWSLQDFSPDDFINALAEQKQTVFERYGETTEVANLPLHSWRMPRVFQRFLGSRKN